MTCPRCEGYMVSERFESTRIDSGEPEFIAWRCVNCGTIVDQVIAANRHRMEATACERAGVRADLIAA